MLSHVVMEFNILRKCQFSQSGALFHIPINNVGETPFACLFYSYLLAPDLSISMVRSSLN